MNSLTKADIKQNTKVLVRADLDVPVANGQITETYRLDCLLPTLKYILAKGGFPVIIGHMGRPEGKVDPKLSTSQLKLYFDQALGGDNYELLENLRFDAREEANDPSFAQELAAKADIYILECFSTITRNHASIIGIPKILKTYAGLQLEKETEHLSKLLRNPKKPFITIIGGIKIESKLPVVTKFAAISSYVLLGAGTGQEYEKLDAQTKAQFSNVLTPLDYDERNYDIGKLTLDKYCSILKSAKSILWSGPMGWFENPRYEAGTNLVIEAIVEATKNGAFSVIGGGDTVAAVSKFGYLHDFSFVSTGGSAMLQFLAGEQLPGLKVLSYYT